MAIQHADRDEFPLLFFFFKARLRSLRCIVLTTLSVLVVLRAAVQLFIQVLETSTLMKAWRMFACGNMASSDLRRFVIMLLFVHICGVTFFLLVLSLTVDKWNLHSYYYQYKKNLTNNIYR